MVEFLQFSREKAPSISCPLPDVKSSLKKANSRLSKQKLHPLKWDQVDRRTIFLYKVTWVQIVDNFSFSLILIFILQTNNVYRVKFSSNVILIQIRVTVQFYWNIKWSQAKDESHINCRARWVEFNPISNRNQSQTQRRSIAYSHVKFSLI